MRLLEFFNQIFLQMMKRQIITLFAIALLSGGAYGQIKTAAPSPFCSIKQTVGLTEVEIEYSRPSVKDRTIFGDLVPYGERWRTGANASTKIGFSTDVKIAGNDVKAGKYALYTIPGPETWTIILYKDLTAGGMPNPWKEEEELMRFTVPSKKVDYKMESMLIHVNNLRNNTATIELFWENTVVGFEVDFNTAALVQAGIDRTLSGPSANDYYLAARFYNDEKKDLSQALTWARKSNEMEPRYWRLFLQAELEAQLTQYDAAIQTAEQSKALAEKEGNTGHVRNVEKFVTDVKAKMGVKTKEAEKVKPNKPAAKY